MKAARRVLSFLSGHKVLLFTGLVESQNNVEYGRIMITTKRLIIFLKGFNSGLSSYFTEIFQFVDEYYFQNYADHSETS
jgi:hypothetical protein